jgi:ribosomal 50S subunit-recycling heat shock protein
VSAHISSTAVKVNRKGIGKIRVGCSKSCRGKVTVKGKGIKASKKVKVGSKHTKLVKLKFSKKEVRKIRQKHRIKSKATAKLAGKTVHAKVKVVPTKKK